MYRQTNVGSGASLLAILAGLVGLGGQASAQVTNVSVDTLGIGGASISNTTVDNGMSANVVVRGGLASGVNLFHSFQAFDVGTGAVVTYSAAGWNVVDVHNLISIVVGGDSSDIYGAIDTTAFTQADYFLINPAGLVLGPGAALDVAGSVHLSTADRIHFADDSELVLTALAGSTFSISDPASFGFVNGAAAVQVANDATISLLMENPQRGSFTLSGGDVSFGENTRIQTNLNFAAIAVGVGDVFDLDPMTLSSAVFGGELTVGKATFLFDEGRGFFGGGDILMNGATINTISTDPLDALRIKASDNLSINGSSIQTFGRGAQAGNIVLTGQTIDIGNASRIESNGVDGGSGGQVFLFAGDSIVLSGATLIASDALGAASVNAGGVTMSAQGMISLSGASQVLARTGSAIPQVNLDQTGAGAITVTTGDLLMSDNSRLSTLSIGARNAGLVTVNVGNSITLSGASDINSIANGSGSAGNIAITFGDLFDLLGDSTVLSGVNATTARAAGQISITSLDGDLTISGGSEVSAVTFSTLSDTLRLGSITVDVGAITLDDGAISVDGHGAQRAGSISVSADRTIELNNGSSIASSATNALLDGTMSEATGAAGDVTVRFGDSLDLNGASEIGSNAPDANTRTAGNVTITSDFGRLSMSGGSEISAITGSTRPFTSAGVISVDVGALDMTSASGIVAESTGVQDAGQVTVHVDTTAELSSHARITSSATGLGSAGAVTLDFGESLVLSGVSEISSDASGPDTLDAGLVTVHSVVGVLSMAEGSQISATSDSLIAQSDPNANGAGSVSVDVGQVNLSGIGTTISAKTRGARNAGSVTIAADNSIVLDDHAEITTTATAASTGGAGEIILRAGAGIVLDGASAVNSRSLSTLGNAGAGRISIGSEDAPVDYLHLLNGGNIGTTSINAGRAGSITINAGDLLLSGSGLDTNGEVFFSQITARNEGSGAAGNVIIDVGDTVTLAGHALITSSTTGSGSAGNITLDFGSLLNLSGASEISSDASGSGAAGFVTVLSADGELSMTEGSQISTVSNSLIPQSQADHVGVFIDVGEVRLSGIST